MTNDDTDSTIDLGLGDLIIAPASTVTIGTGAAGVDYKVKINGESNDVSATWMEDEDWLSVDKDINLGTHKLCLDSAGTCTDYIYGYNNALRMASDVELAVVTPFSAYGAFYSSSTAQFLAGATVGDAAADPFTIYSSTISWGQGGDSDFCVDVNTNDVDSTNGLCWGHTTGKWIVDNTMVFSNATDAIWVGAGAAGVDYQITFDGETHDGSLQWMEDEDQFKFISAAGDMTIDIEEITGNKIIFDSTTGVNVWQFGSVATVIAALFQGEGDFSVVHLGNPSASLVLCRRASDNHIGYCTSINTTTGACTCN
jgi:hypothetical protein